MYFKFWIKAFIPDELKTLSGEQLNFLVKFLKENSSEEFSVIPVLALWPHLFPLYTTDQRIFSPDITAPARLTTIIESVNIFEPKSIKISRYCDPSFQIASGIKNLNGKSSRY